MTPSHEPLSKNCVYNFSLYQIRKYYILVNAKLPCAHPYPPRSIIIDQCSSPPTLEVKWRTVDLTFQKCRNLRRRISSPHKKERKIYPQPHLILAQWPKTRSELTPAEQDPDCVPKSNKADLISSYCTLPSAPRAPANEEKCPPYAFPQQPLRFLFPSLRRLMVCPAVNDGWLAASSAAMLRRDMRR